MSRQYWGETLAWATADGTPVANTTTETIIFNNTLIPPNYMSDGRVIRIRAFGKLSTTGTPTIIFAIRWGGVGGDILAQTEAITTASASANFNWSLEAIVQTRSNGATGTLLAMGVVVLQTNQGADPTTKSHVFSVSGGDAPAAVTVDLTTEKALAITADWSAQSASNTLTGMLLTIDSLN